MHSTAARRWAALIDQAESSGLTNREFARQVGVNANTLAWWKWRLRSIRIRREAEPTFIEVIPQAPVPEPLRLSIHGRVFVEVTDRTDLDLLRTRTVVDALC